MLDFMLVYAFFSVIKANLKEKEEGRAYRNRARRKRGVYAKNINVFNKARMAIYRD